MSETGQTSGPACIGCHASRFMMIAIIGSYLVMYVSSLLTEDTSRAAAPAGMVLVASDEALNSGAFFLDSREVTNAEFAVFVSKTGYITQAEKSGSDKNWRRPQGTTSTAETDPDLPVITLSRADAEAFARWSGKRLLGGAELRFARSKGLLINYSGMLSDDEYSESTLSSSGFRCAADVLLTSH